jgi:pimeloyl-ACP methyl ester carboxylesterase
VRSLIPARVHLDWLVSQPDVATQRPRRRLLDEFFDEHELHHLAGVGHYVSLEAPQAVADATVRALPR